LVGCGEDTFLMRQLALMKAYVIEMAEMKEWSA
jgi:hypothetical protein